MSSLHRRGRPLLPNPRLLNPPCDAAKGLLSHDLKGMSWIRRACLPMSSPVAVSLRFYSLSPYPTLNSSKVIISFTKKASPSNLSTHGNPTGPNSKARKDLVGTLLSHGPDEVFPGDVALVFWIKAAKASVQRSFLKLGLQETTLENHRQAAESKIPGPIVAASHSW